MSSIIGVDEAGRGPVLGPLVVAGIKLRSASDEKLLVEIKVRDSKKCTPKRREKLADHIRRISKYQIMIMPAHDIDEHRKTKTMNKLEVEMFAEVINSLAPAEDSTVIVDAADANETRFGRDLEARLDIKCKILSKHKADERYPVVAAASIIAKTERDSQIRNIARELKADLGSGYPSDIKTRIFLENWIKENGDLPPYTRHSWNTAKKLLTKFHTSVKTLDQFFE